MVNILFTARVAGLNCLQRSERLSVSGVEGRIVAVDVDPLAPALQTADVRYLVPSLNSPDYIRVLADIAGV